MTEPTYRDRLDDVFFRMGLRTFDPPLTLDYRFGSFQAEEGIFRCFVMQEDVMQAPNYLEIKGDQIYWLALEYPGIEPLLENMNRVALRCFKTLGRTHTANFILALENGLPPEERRRLEEAFDAFRNTLPVGTYHTLRIWDTEGLKEQEKKIPRPLDASGQE